jgi:hypothetical protein
MSDIAPVLLLGFNRPDKMAQLITALEQSRPSHILIAVDGPRVTHPNDIELVRQTQEKVGLVNWEARIETRFRNENLGLRDAVVDAVSWATSQYGKVIVIEDDCIPGPDFVPFAGEMLNRFRYAEHIGHINGYNLVPPRYLKNPTNPIRLSRYPESYAWATWDRAWKKYDNDLTWAQNCSLTDLKEITQSFWGAVRWKINFADAYAERINTWAYRWLASMWANDLTMIAPTNNLVRYDGHDEGTHTRRRARWTELPLISFQYGSNFTLTEDSIADCWLGNQVFRENLLGVIEGVATSCAMEVIKRRKK